RNLAKPLDHRIHRGSVVFGNGMEADERVENDDVDFCTPDGPLKHSQRCVVESDDIIADGARDLEREAQLVIDEQPAFDFIAVEIVPFKMSGDPAMQLVEIILGADVPDAQTGVL